MARSKRPAAVTVMGILNIVFGSLGLLCNICSGFGVMIMASGSGNKLIADNPFLQFQTTLWEVQAQHVPGFREVQIGSLLFGLVMSIVLLVSGIGMLNLAGWGRNLGLFYGVAVILFQLGTLGYDLTVVNAQMPAVLEDLQQLQQQGKVPAEIELADLDNNPVALAIKFGVALISVTYSVILLSVLLGRTTKAAFAGTGADPDRPDYGEGDDMGYQRDRGDEAY